GEHGNGLVERLVFARAREVGHHHRHEHERQSTMGRMWLAWFVACGPDDAETIDVVDVAPWVETLLPGAVGGHAAAGASVYAVTPEGGRWFDAAGRSTVYGDAPSGPLGIGELGGDRLVLADGLLALREPATIDLGLSLEPDALCVDGAEAFLSTADGLFVWRPPDLTELRVDGAALPGPMACGGSLDGERVVWVADGSQVHAIASNAVAAVVFDSVDLGAPVDAVAIDGRGQAWAAAGGALHRRTGATWEELVLPDDVAGTIGAVLGGARSTGVWVVGADGPHWLDGRLARPDGLGEPRGPWLTDGLGRLVVHDGAGLHRIAVDRPLWVEGVTPGTIVTEAVMLRVVPTAPDELTALTLSLVGADATAELEVDEVGSARLDPVVHPPGAYVLTAEATYPDQAATFAIDVELVALGAITWDAHIGPLHEARCAVCHTGSTETVLDGAEPWAGQIEAILGNVRSGAMPLGGPALTDGEVRQIEAWRDNGFP
ncbi:MAG: hypothetical protein AAF602_30830, partial [Myxococcota bacterium]